MKLKNIVLISVPLSIIFIILLIIIIYAIVYSVHPKEEYHNSNPNIIHDPINWMSELRTNNPSIPLKKIIIPGSHNSGTFSLSETSCPGNALFKTASVLIPSFLNNLSRTQTLNLIQQFEIGIRAFDFRPCFYENKYYNFHALLANLFLDDITTLVDLAKKYPKELIICNVNPYSLTKQQCYDLEVQVYEIVKPVLNQSVNNSDYLDSFLNNFIICWQASKLMKFTYNSWNTSVKNDSEILFSPEDVYNRERHFLENYSSKESNTFKVSNLVCGPNATVLVLRPWTTNRMLASEMNNKALVDYEGWEFNIVLFDHVEDYGLISHFIERNFI